ncbi:MAG: type II secretion system F family protein [Ilumatobacteraceae bacterium]
MTSVVAALIAGSVIGLGVFILSAAWRGTLRLGGASIVSEPGRMRHLAVGVVMLAATWSLTGWTVAAVTIAMVASMASVALHRHTRRRDERALVDALAVWTEQLRDMLTGSSGLEHTIVATSTHAPAALRDPLERLVASMSYVPLTQGLSRFAREVDHPTADFVVAALTTAATRQVRELGALLGHLATCARDEARMHTRIWVGRSRTRSAVRIIASVVVTFVVGLVMLSPEYLAPYQSPEGQFVLSGVVLTFFGALLAMQRLAVVVAPERFVGRRIENRQ